ncbi:eighth largest subunit of RSC [Scheffersomyces amazonensis]|uniref:eighth largest subunit of RSC n=1 Tax=Scheffersomyces amazonensis TaxID=1078765 RepID=UPI00315CF838
MSLLDAESAGSVSGEESHVVKAEGEAQAEAQAQAQAQAQSQSQEDDKVDVEKLKNEFREKAKTYLAEQGSHIIIPSFAKWFDLGSIHSIERKSFPDFFNENNIINKSPYKTEEIYKNMRDFIVNTFRLNPKEYLTITSIRKNLAGDVSVIIRIHQFLERWGIINYQIDPRTKPSSMGPQYTGHFQITLDSPTGLVPLIPENSKIINDNNANNNNNNNTTSLPSPEPSSSELDSTKINDISLNLEVRRNIYTSTSKKSNYKPETIVHYSCNICGKDATKVRYHNLKIKSYTHNPSSTINNASILCTICYDQGLFPSNFLSSDFIKLTELNQLDEWSEQEILLLLEGIEMFGTYEPPTLNGNINANSNSQWDKISEHIGTKSKEQSLIKFIQLPIEDQFLNKLIGDKNKIKSLNSSNEDIIQSIVNKLINNKSGKELIKQNSNQALEESINEQTNLINQIVELTLEKVNHKLNKVDSLSDNLLRVEKQLNLERKQLAIERWAQFEKFQRLKIEKPELGEILDDLLKPIKINEINKSLIPLEPIIGENKMEIDSEKNQQEIDKLPISVSKPKSYQYWSG